MPIHSRWNVPLEESSFPTFLLGKPGSTLPDKIAYLDADRPDTHFLTIEAFRLWSQRLAVGLRKAGLKEGDRVLLFSGNNIWFPVAFVGILMAGGVFSGANPGYVARELAYQLQNSGAKFLLCADANLELGIEAAQSIGMSKDQIFQFDDEVLDGTGISSLGVANWSTLFASEAESKDFICSGTTGVPKGVMITHYNYIANTTQFVHLAQLAPDYEETTKNARWLCYVPMYHAMGQAIFIGTGPKRGIPVYMMKKFDLAKMLGHVQKHKITTLNMVPPIVVLLGKSPLTKKYDLSSVIEIGSGAAPLGGDAIAQVEALWPKGNVKMKQGWGMTEATCTLLGWDPTKESLPDSVGELNTNCHAKIMDVDGKTEVPTGERGEIWVQSPNIMKGYWQNEKATREMIIEDSDGRWLRTGDIAYVDSQGRFFIVDRMKELIKVKGNQVAPAELEALLLEHPQLSDAAVVGVTIEGEEVPRAYVVLREGGKTGAKEVQEWLAKRVSKHKRIVGGCVFVESIPKNPSGKIMRRVLRERAMEEVGDKKAKL